MRIHRTRSNDSTFELNLAPFLDIIVSVIPLLLLSVAFIHVKMIAAPTPQVVSEDNLKKPPVPEASIVLRISKVNGFEFAVTDVKGKLMTTNIALSNGILNFDALLTTAIKIKETYPNISSVQLSPNADVSFDEIIKVMDRVRHKDKVSELLFPDVTFATIGG